MLERRKDSKGRVLRNGEVQRADGKYMYRYVDLAGKRHSIYSWKLVSTDKVPEGKRDGPALRDSIKKIQRDLDDGIRTQDAKERTIDSLFEDFMEMRSDLKPSTKCNYANLYDTHLRQSFGQRKVGSVRATDVQKLYISLAKDRGLRMSTIRSINNIMYQVLELAVVDNVIRMNPANNAMKVLKKVDVTSESERRALSEQQQERLVEYVYKSRVHKRWGTLITVLLGTGARIGEALGLRWCDCDFKHNTIHIDHSIIYKPPEHGASYQYRISAPKTKAGIREIPMFKDVKKALQKEKKKKRDPNLAPFVVDGYQDFIFLNNNGKVFTPGTVFEALQNIVADYNREEAAAARKEQREPCYLPRFSAHILRHTFCTRLCEHERDIKIVQDIMGHKNYTTTMDVYNEATATRKQASFQDIEGKFRIA